MTQTVFSKKNLWRGQRTPIVITTRVCIYVQSMPYFAIYVFLCINDLTVFLVKWLRRRWEGCVCMCDYTRLYSFKLSWRIVSFTAAKTNRIFSVSKMKWDKKLFLGITNYKLLILIRCINIFWISTFMTSTNLWHMWSVNR